MTVEMYTYKELAGEALHLKVYAPTRIRENAALHGDDTLLSQEVKLGAIVFFYGGGWVDGNLDQFKPQSEYLAAHGIVAVTVDYRVFNRHQTSPIESVEDAKSAVSWVRKHAEELGIDSARIAVCGASAGGHLAASAAMVPGFIMAEEECLARPDLLILFNPVTDTTETGYQNKASGMIADRLQEISPIHHMTDGLPDTLLFHGTADDVVPILHSERFCQAMVERGNSCTMVSVDEAGHGFFNYGEAYETTLMRLIQFLQEHGWMPGLSSDDSEVFSDPGFDHGFRLSTLHASHIIVDTLLFDADPVKHGGGIIVNEPSWKLAQWWSKHSLEGVKPFKMAPNVSGYVIPGKKVVRYPNGELYLEVAGSQEYERPRRHNEPWPHLLIEQKFTPGMSLASVRGLRFHVEVKLDFIQDHMTHDEYDPELHAAKVSAFFAVKNQNEASASWGDYIWFGIPIYDSRYDIFPGYQAQDAGKATATNKFIYTLDGRKVWERPVHDGQWHSLDIDLLPHMRTAVQTAASRGYLRDAAFSDLHVESFNLGWEVTGTYDAAMRLKQLHLQKS